MKTKKLSIAEKSFVNLKLLFGYKVLLPVMDVKSGFLI
jgi:hypothetical protein